MADVERLLAASAVRIAVRDPRRPDARFCLRAYFRELAERFDGGFEPGRSIPATDAELTPPAGLLLVATLHGEPAGCGALKFHGAEPTEIKRMWVAPAVRGLGLGRRLLASLEAHAAAGQARVLRLETNRTLVEAISLYRASGYREVEPFNDEPYANHWFEKTLDLPPADPAQPGSAGHGAPGASKLSLVAAATLERKAILMRGRFSLFRSSRALLACVPVAAVVMVASGGAAQAARTPANARTATRAALAHLLGARLSQTTNRQWSGYEDTSTVKFTEVSGSWVQPKATCGPVVSYDVFWVGFDMFTKAQAMRTGSGVICQGASQTYFTWWQLPGSAATIVSRGVKPGDQIAASVTRSGTRYTFKLTDSTTAGNSFSTTQACAAAVCKDISVEWVAEDPDNPLNGAIYPFAKFGTWTLTNATVTAGTTRGTITSFPHTEITMADSSGKVLAQPGPLNSSGNSFQVAWKAVR
jgi:GNAT superfamily N-acetyltransferase